ncbi:MAG: right-handed parallel beta-helix repeat-containing protein [Bryobacteraceae bacterium]|jgi:parallel beta-helix repeat protein
MSLVQRVSAKFEGSKAALSLLGVILIALGGVAVPAQAAFKSITTCNPTLAVSSGGSLINAAGDYQLTGNLTQSTANTDCIQITASNVSLKLNGHQITSTAGGGSGIDVNPSGPPQVSHVAIQGPGLIQGFQNGIFFLDANYSQVDLVTAANNTYGIYGFNTTSLTIGSNVLVRNGQWGLLLGNSTGGTIQNNEASGNGAATAAGGFSGGIGLGGASNANTVNNNTASGNGPQSVVPAIAAGILIGGAGNGNRVYGNTTDGNIFAGIQVKSTGNSIFGNSSVGNGAYDLEDDNPACDSNLWGGNNFFTANQACIH